MTAATPAPNTSSIAAVPSRVLPVFDGECVFALRHINSLWSCPLCMFRMITAMTTMAAKYILAVLGAAFLVTGNFRRRSHPEGRTWSLVGVLFAAVAAWLFYRG